MVTKGSRFKPGRWYAVAGFLFFGALAAGASYHVGSQIVHLHRVGQAARGTVVGVRVEVKGLRRAVVRYHTAQGEEVEARDLHKTQFIDPNDVGDEVTLRYDPSEPQLIVIDRGGWEWLNSGFLAFGALMCLGFGVVFAFSKQGRS